MTKTVCLGGPFHGRTVHLLSDPAQNEDGIDKSGYTLGVLKGQHPKSGTEEQRQFYVLDTLTEKETTDFAADHWLEGAILEDD